MPIARLRKMSGGNYPEGGPGRDDMNAIQIELRKTNRAFFSAKRCFRLLVAFILNDRLDVTRGVRNEVTRYFRVVSKEMARSGDRAISVYAIFSSAYRLYTPNSRIAAIIARRFSSLGFSAMAPADKMKPPPTPQVSINF
jgi:hypothetical protein